MKKEVKKANKTEKSIAFDENDVLVKEAKVGNARAINKLCMVNYKYAYNILYFKCKNRELAEDLTQDVLVKMIENLKQYSKTEYKFSAWLSSIINSVFVDHLRKASGKVDRNTSLVDFNYKGSVDEEGNESGFTNYVLKFINEPGVEEKFIASESKEKLYKDLEKAIESLSDDQKRVIRLSLEELSYDQIVNQTGLSLDNVKVLLFRAKKEIAKFIIAKNIDASGNRLTKRITEMNVLSGVQISSIANTIDVSKNEAQNIVKAGLKNIYSESYAGALVEA
jgi:RNA polymerase sigma-70 factor (ECF subfamily)